MGQRKPPFWSRVVFSIISLSVCWDYMGYFLQIIEDYSGNQGAGGGGDEEGHDVDVERCIACALP